MKDTVIDTHGIEPDGKGDLLPKSSAVNSDSLEVVDCVGDIQRNDSSKTLLSVAHHSSDSGDLDDEEHNRTSDGLKNKFSKWKTKATSLYEDNNSISKIKKMGNALEVKSGFKMGIKMSSNALGSVVHAVLPHPKTGADEGKLPLPVKDKKSVSIAVDTSSHHSVVSPNHTETTSSSSSIHVPMSTTLNSGLMVNVATSNSSSYSSSDDEDEDDRQEDSDSTEESHVTQEDGVASHHHGHEILENSNQPTPSKRFSTARSEADLQSLSSPPPSSPNLIRGRYAPSSSSKPPQKKRSSLDQIQSGITSVATITTGIAAMSAFTAGQTSSNISSNTSSLAHSSSQLSDSGINIASLNNFPPGQYGVTIGPGMLGVHLKQSYWPTKGGVYIDSIVPGGHAEKSKVMMIGDTILKVGDVDVSKGTVADVPKIIGRARRPVVLVCTGEFPVEGDKVCLIFLS